MGVDGIDDNDFLDDLLKNIDFNSPQTQKNKKEFDKKSKLISYQNNTDDKQENVGEKMKNLVSDEEQPEIDFDFGLDLKRILSKKQINFGTTTRMKSKIFSHKDLDNILTEKDSTDEIISTSIEMNKENKTSRNKK
ncbi:hypothetical protein M0813_21266 [Anaeramoeba flamelloides]|uniref:Uncharacterized protein n=1 Tax=Anaeramoeba flamelloides TaxID=1746091 RepID=A0ABQ8YHD8_9EUKA|nr:hypothetical protein M0813_21266 [Anaeramoeba flamelloides]